NICTTARGFPGPRSRAGSLLWCRKTGSGDTSMAHVEALPALAPAAAATDALVDFASALRYEALDAETRHYARRHLLDTVGCMIAGAGGDVATRAEAVVGARRPAGDLTVAP